MYGHLKNIVKKKPNKIILGGKSVMSVLSDATDIRVNRCTV